MTGDQGGGGRVRGRHRRRGPPWALEDLARHLPPLLPGLPRIRCHVRAGF
ncbi:hypothetical protein SSCG_05945 [Streptomyces clavuligerus]|nr:hypothetical protein SSCG_05945 [Streptomyces clavuligerus]